MRASGEQAKTVSGNLQMCADLEAGIEGVTHTVGQRRLERVRVKLQEEKYVGDSDKEEESREVADCLNNIIIETTEIEEEAAERLENVMVMEVEDTGEGEEGGEGTKRTLGTLEFLTKDAELSGILLVDARNGFNELSRLEMMWAVRHRWPAGGRFAFN